MLSRTKAAIGGALVGLALLGATAGPAFAQTPPAPPSPVPSPSADAPFTRAQMEKMMDAIHGAGSFQRMEQAMGPNANQLIDQCVTMMNTMSSMSSMMGGQNGSSAQSATGR